MSSGLTNLLLAWFQDQGRELPWRRDITPYRVWVAEIMLQQTRIDTVIPYYTSWMERFPNLNTLANATLQEVLAVWEGLGYYQRAQNMHKTAGIVAAELGGELPGDPSKLMKLPGIGKYTAGAIASIAFGFDEPALDGNVRRVLARLFDVSEPERSPQGEKQLWELARDCLPKGKAGIFNQAMMDLGAIICTPRNHACQACPLQSQCRAKKLGVQSLRPVRMPKASIPRHVFGAAIILKEGLVLLSQRPGKGLLGSLWEFPGGKLSPAEDLQTCLRSELKKGLGVDITIGNLVGIYRHAYTHFRVTLHVFGCQLDERAQPKPIKAQDLRWVNINRLSDYPMGKLDRTIARKLQRGSICLS